MDDLEKLLIEWIGIDPATNTLGGWGYRSVAEFFIQHTSLTKKETFQAGGSVCQRFESYFYMINPIEKSIIINAVLNLFPIDARYTKRTPELLKFLKQKAKEFSLPEEQAKIENYKKTLNIENFDTLENLPRAYKLQIAKYHPDKVASMGDEIKEVAERQTKSINEAFESLKVFLRS
jgi:DnaJ like chaperone protein